MDFEDLYRATYPRVLAYARSMASPEDADDAVAEAYAIAWRRQHDIPRGAELGWLIGVTRRVLANARRSGRRAGALHALLDLQPKAAGLDRPSACTTGELRDALLELSPLDREAVVLTAWFDLSSADAARALGITPAAFRMRSARARRRLRAALNPAASKEQPRWETTVIEDRLRAARPEAATVDEDAFDADLLAQRQRLPASGAAAARGGSRSRSRGRRDARRGRGADVRAADPGDVGGPPAAAARSTRAALAQPAGRHRPARPQRRDPGRPHDHPRDLAARRRPGRQPRAALDGAIRYETVGNSLYDPPATRSTAHPRARSQPTASTGSSATRSSRRSGSCSRTAT